MKETTITTRNGTLTIKPAKKSNGGGDGVRVYTGTTYYGVHLNTVRRLSRAIEALLRARALLFEGRSLSSSRKLLTSGHNPDTL